MVKKPKEEVPVVPIPKTVKKYKLAVTFTEIVLGSSPSDPEVYKKFILSKVKEEKENLGEEVETLPAVDQEQAGWTVFHKDENGLFLFDYKVRGFFKEASAAITGTGITARHSKLDKWLFVFPRRLSLMREDGVTYITEPDGVLERPLRIGPKLGVPPHVALKRSDKLGFGTKFSCVLHVMPLGQREFTEEVIKSWLDYGQYSGMSDWRTASYGRFTYELTPLDD